MYVGYQTMIVWDEFLQRRQIRVIDWAEAVRLVSADQDFLQEQQYKLFMYMHNPGSAAESIILQPHMTQNVPCYGDPKWRGDSDV